jgi:hypothetical protein
MEVLEKAFETLERDITKRRKLTKKKQISDEILKEQRRILTRELLYNVEVMLNPDTDHPIEYYGPKEKDYGSMYYKYEKELFMKLLIKYRHYINVYTGEGKEWLPVAIIESTGIAERDVDGNDTEEIKISLLKMAKKYGLDFRPRNIKGKEDKNIEKKINLVLIALGKKYNKIAAFLQEN